jgi:hypothetical protein
MKTKSDIVHELRQAIGVSQDTAGRMFNAMHESGQIYYRDSVHGFAIRRGAYLITIASNIKLPDFII